MVLNIMEIIKFGKQIFLLYRSKTASQYVALWRKIRLFPWLTGEQYFFKLCESISFYNRNTHLYKQGLLSQELLSQGFLGQASTFFD
jgi:hypothetical protein